MPQASRTLSDQELLSIFNDSRADLSLLNAEEQQRLLTLTDQGVYRGLSKATGISPNTRVDRLIRSLPMVGGIAGSLAGGGKWNQLGMMGAALGGMAGEAAAQAVNTLRGRPDLVPPTPGAQVGRMAWQGAAQGGLEGTGRGVANLAQRGARFFMNSAIRPGLRVLDEAGRPITAQGTLSDQFPRTDIVGEALSRKVPIRNRGLVEADAGVKAARQRAMEAIRLASARRPKVAGLLPEGRTPLALGETPIPAGGAPTLQRAAATQRVPWNQQRARQGMSADPTVTQVYGGMPAKTAPSAMGDTVEGAGIVMLPRSQVATDTGFAPLIPKGSAMVGVEEALAPVKAYRESIENKALPKIKRLWDKLIAEYEGEYKRPVDLVIGQERKDLYADNAEQLYRRGKAPQTTQFYKLLGDGYRKAIEARVPAIRELNRETETQLALKSTLLKALNRESQSSRWTFAGALDNPRLWGTVAHTARRGATAARMAPNTLRGLLMANDVFAPEETR